MITRSGDRDPFDGSVLPSLRTAIERAADRDAARRGALAVAVTYCVPELVEAVVGPDRLSCTGSLSTSSVSAGALTTPAALLPASVSDSGPLVGT